MSKKILEINNLSKQFIVRRNIYTKSRIDAVKNISFGVYPKESLGLIGESGCGKTTTANMILRLVEPDEGSIKFFGMELTELDEQSMRKLRKDIQIIFQHSSAVLDNKMTVEELLREPLRIHKIVSISEENREVTKLLNMVGIASSERLKFPGQLSGGQNQRIIIARAIATRPKIIVCDEPMSA
ncbi:MAG: ABC transporter ATP-binding protein, partial [Clostridia bacterium]|nr:ABC transporter ATP-binding protein [Clostridia bacterium]